MSDTRVGECVEILHVFEEDRRFLDYLDRQRLRVRARLQLEHKDCDETVEALVAGRTVHLGKSAAEKIWVKPIRG